MFDSEMMKPGVAAMPLHGTLEDLVRPLLDIVARLTGMESTYLTRIDLQAGEQEILIALNRGELDLPEGLRVPWDDTLCKRALEEENFATCDVATTWPESDAAAALGLTSYVSTPVRFSDGRLYGTLCGASRRSTSPTPEAIEMLGLLSAMIGRHAEAAARAEFAEQGLTRMALVAEVGQLCLDANDLKTTVTRTAELLNKLPGWACVMAFTRESDRYRPVSESDILLAPLTESIIESFGDRLWRRHDSHNIPWLKPSEVPETLRHQLVKAGLTDDRGVALLTAATPFSINAGIILVPSSTQMLGVRDQQMMISCSNMLSMLSDRLDHQGRLEASNEALADQAHRDALTGLPNRRAVMDHLGGLLEGADKGKQQVMLAFIDLDGFKKINDQNGHDAGDRFLNSFARRLQSGLRSDDWVARLGGDEFVVVSTTGAGRDSVDIARYLAERIDRATAGRYDLGDTVIDYGGASIGIVDWRGETVNELLRRADSAMYAVKRKRHGNGEHLH